MSRFDHFDRFEQLYLSILKNVNWMKTSNEQLMREVVKLLY